MSLDKKNPPEWKPKGNRPDFETVLLIMMAIGTGLMAFLAMLGLIPETGILAYAKSAIVAIVASIVSYSINRFAIEKGAPLAATGYALAAIVSVVSILLVGVGLFASTYAGMTITPVNELQLQRHGQALVRHVGEENAKFAKAARTVPVIQSIRDDLNQKVACEMESSCISGRGNGGRGSVTRAMEALAGRADTITSQLLAGDAKRQKLMATLNDQLAAFQTMQGDPELSLNERRQQLIGIDAAIGQSLNDIGEAVPTPLLVAYAQELLAGVNIDGRIEATDRLNTILGDHGRALESVIATIKNDETLRPSFPAQAGVSSTFEYIGHFLPIAAITAVVELVLPLALWIYTLIQIVWDKESRSPRAAINASPALPETPLDNAPLNRDPQRSRHGFHNGGKHNQPGAR